MLLPVLGLHIERLNEVQYPQVCDGLDIRSHNVYKLSHPRSAEWIVRAWEQLHSISLLHLLEELQDGDGLPDPGDLFTRLRVADDQGRYGVAGIQGMIILAVLIALYQVDEFVFQWDSF